MSDDRYVRFDPFADERDVDIRCRTVKLVTTRKEQTCCSPWDGKLHKIPPGTRARFETALVDGKWGRYYVCTDCMDKWFDPLSNGRRKERDDAGRTIS